MFENNFLLYRKEVDDAARGGMQRRPSATQRALPESISYRVKQSWEVLANDHERMEKVGISFFLHMFHDHPELLSIFPFGNFLAENNGPEKKLPPALKMHALMVIETMGKFVTGLTKLEDLVPMLRALGQIHDTAGVQAQHYNIMIKYLFEAMKEELSSPAEDETENSDSVSTELLSDCDKENEEDEQQKVVTTQSLWDEDTEEAWELAFRTIVNIITKPNERLQIEPLEGWGAVNALSCAFLAFAGTPIQLAGFTALRPNLQRLLHLLTFLSVVCLAIDMVSHGVAQRLRIRSKLGYGGKPKKRSFIRRKVDEIIHPYLFKVSRFLRGLRMERWESWPRMDAVIIFSFLVEYVSHVIARMIAGWSFEYRNISAGIHWSCLFGLVRMIAGARVNHYWTCAENNVMLRRRLDSDERTQLRIFKLFLAMILVVHISACLWCVVARIELGESGNSDEPEATVFFPHPEYLLGRAGILKSYVHACHWSFVNLAGIGDVDSSPDSALECVFMLMIHIVGMTFYAIMTGNVVTILTEITEKQNVTGDDLTALGDFMHKCAVPLVDQKRILHGYVMQEMSSGNTDDSESGNDGQPNKARKDYFRGVSRHEDEKGDLCTVPYVVERKLPSFLKQEINLFARAQAVKSREGVFSNCCQNFLFAVAGALSETQILLPGDFLFGESDPLPNSVFFIEDGIIDVIHEGKCLRTLKRGNIIGKQWLLQDVLSSRSNPADDDCKKVSFRALTSCTLLSGLSDRTAIAELWQRYPRDFLMSRHQRDQLKTGTSGSFQKKSIARQSVLPRNCTRHSILQEESIKHSATQPPKVVQSKKRSVLNLRLRATTPVQRLRRWSHSEK